VTDMSVIGRNIFANFFGIALVTALTVAITPAQIRILGVEAFGIVGFIATLQLAFTALDLGLSSTLTRAYLWSGPPFSYILELLSWSALY
jgi:O-antigen/teichoic acid export membrane protein